LMGTPPASPEEEVMRGQCRSLFSKAADLNASEKKKETVVKAKVRRQSMFGRGLVGSSIETRAQFGNDGCVWMKDGFLRWMDKAVAAHLDLFATKIQSIALGFMARRRYQKQLACIRQIQAVGRTCAPKRNLKRSKQATTYIAATARRLAAKKVVDKLREIRRRNNAVTKIATIARRRAATKRVAHKRANRSNDAMITIAKAWRRHKCLMNYVKQKRRVLRLQCYTRRIQAVQIVAARRKSLREKKSATYIQC
jgi:myosin heavy subunit